MIQQSEEKLTLATKLKNQELGVISLLLGGLQVLKANLIPIITIGLVINLPLIVISEKLLPIFTEQSGLAIISLYGQIILLICQIPAWAAVITIVEQYVINGKANPISALKRAFSKWSKFLWKENKTNWEAMIALAFFFASDYLANIFPFNLLLLIPGYIFLVRIFFIMEARYLRDLDIDSADIYSKSVVQGRWKKVFFIITSLAINNYLLAVLFAITLNLLAEIIPAIKPGVDITFYFIRTLINDIWFIVGTLLFLNLEYRKN